MPDGLQRMMAAVAVALTAPLIGLLGLVVRLDSPGPAFYVAVRVGEGGRPFGLLKLRTMRPGAATFGPAVSPVGDQRVTRFGRVLRRTRLDELPQLWNIVRGEMRLVGPRPEDPRYLDPANPLHRRVAVARPGITGLAQLVHTDEASRLDPLDPDGSYRSAIQPMKLALDARYLDHRSSSLDLWILLQTIRAVFGHPPSPAAIEERLRTGRPV